MDILYRYQIKNKKVFISEHRCLKYESKNLIKVEGMGYITMSSLNVLRQNNTMVSFDQTLTKKFLSYLLDKKTHHMNKLTKDLENLYEKIKFITNLKEKYNETEQSTNL